MKTQVKSIYDYSKEKYHLSFLAGDNGLNNTVFWTYLAEDIHNTSFLKGGELIITTGLFLNNGILLYDFIHDMAIKNCSGIIINIGKYIFPEDITEEIIEFCNYNKLPLFTIPWDIHIIDIMQDYSHLLMQDSHRDDYLSAAFQSSLYQTPISEHALRTLNHDGFPTSANYRIIVIKNLPDTTIITSPLNRLAVKYHLFHYDNSLILIYLVTSASLALQDMIHLICYCDDVILGASNEFNHLGKIEQNYKRARFAFAIATFWQQPFTIFDELGVFQILYSNSDPELMLNIYKKRLGILEAYDLKHNTDYINTLHNFLLSDCNLVATASKLFTHRNTIVYRIRKIKELLGTELNTSVDKFDLLLAFYIKEYLAL